MLPHVVAGRPPFFPGVWPQTSVLAMRGSPWTPKSPPDLATCFAQGMWSEHPSKRTSKADPTVFLNLISDGHTITWTGFLGHADPNCTIWEESFPWEVEVGGGTLASGHHTNQGYTFPQQNEDTHR